MWQVSIQQALSSDYFPKNISKFVVSQLKKSRHCLRETMSYLSMYVNIQHGETTWSRLRYLSVPAKCLD
ncbi:MAG: hypothetical protein ACI8ZB_002018 [Desulforhopalus sp.]|jgi:hypothetical protein